ncbi:MAG: cytochrome c oxidase assembly protein [marine bacterium B5-7]|nr:MAG: cytochrome c oxidase assembly protein [marine bacterium B5-7]
MKNNELKEKNRRLIRNIIIAVIVMFGFSYALVPIYTLVCKQTGINGRSSDTPDAFDANMPIDKSRNIDVTFSTTVHGKLKFDFHPETRHVTVHPGETKLVYFFAQNTTGKGITVQAIPSITPDEAARSLKKTQCFCFTQQYFFKGEKADMPVYFYIDPSLDKSIHEVTLSYTLFDVTDFIKKDQQYHHTGRLEL